MERQRAYWNPKDTDQPQRQLVTIIGGRIGGRGKTEIRDQFGNLREVPAKELERIASTEPHAKLTFEPPSG
jgi:hypothetical protein